MTSTSSRITVAGPSMSDRAAVAAVPQRIIAAWAAHDAEAFAAVFTEDGTMILPGLYRKGREDIRSYLAEAFAGPYHGTRVAGQAVDVRFLSAEVGVLITDGGVLAPGETEVASAHAVRGSWLVVKQQGQWQLAAYQNSPRDAG
jgi:uncharacterized protein (TIGR02246 family)